MFAGNNFTLDDFKLKFRREMTQDEHDFLIEDLIKYLDEDLERDKRRKETNTKIKSLYKANFTKELKFSPPHCLQISPKMAQRMEISESTNETKQAFWLKGFKVNQRGHFSKYMAAINKELKLENVQQFV